MLQMAEDPNFQGTLTGSSQFNPSNSIMSAASNNKQVSPYQIDQFHAYQKKPNNNMTKNGNKVLQTLSKFNHLKNP